LDSNKLSVGILLESLSVPQWAYYMVRQIVQGDYAKIVLVLITNETAPRQREPNCSIGEGVRESIHHIIGRIDKYINPVSPDAFELKNLQEVLPDVPHIDIRFLRQAEYDYVDDQDCDTIQEHDLDVLISLNSRKLRGKILIIPQFGVWAYFHGDYRENTLGGVGLWEVLEGRKETGATLILLSNDQRCEKILYYSLSKTDSFSFNRNNNNNYWKSASFLPRKLQEVQRYGAAAFWQNVKQMNQHPIFFSQRAYKLPNQLEWLRFLVSRLYEQVTHRIWRFFYYEQYILLYKIDKVKLLSTSLESFSMLIPPYDRYWADPFVVHHDDKYYVFIEEVLGSQNKGHIAYFMIEPDGRCTQPQVVLEKPYHMSYPFVFHYNNDYYMVPETAANKTIDLYRCVEFPEKWEYVATIMNDVSAYDATVLYKNNKWWLFVCMRDCEGMSSSDEVFLFFSEDLIAGKWTAHRQNPIVSDVRSARPAGKIFEYNGNLYRPSQNSAKRYGYGMKINHIVSLSEYEYREECVEEVEPLWRQNVLSVHTLNFEDHLTIIDAELQKPRFPAAIYRKIRNLFGVYS